MSARTWSLSIKGTSVPAVLPKFPELKIGKPTKMELVVTPVSPCACPLAMADPLGMVKVGKREWLLWKNTPFSRMLSMVGASVALTEPARRPSATKMITLRGLVVLSPCLSAAKTETDSKRAPMRHRAEVRFIDFSLIMGKMWKQDSLENRNTWITFLQEVVLRVFLGNITTKIGRLVKAELKKN